MSIPFPDIDPYQVLSVKQDATPVEIKKAYRKQCLVHHPDKLVNKPEAAKQHSKLQFEKIAFAYTILGDMKRRKRYDDTGSLADVTSLGDDDDSLDWKTYFDSLKEHQVTEELIEQDKRVYQGSQEELDDVMDAFEYYQGDFLKLFEVIPHLEFTLAEEKRMFEIILKQVAKGNVFTQGVNRKWQLYVKNRDKKAKAYLKKMNREAKEAEELKQTLNISKATKLDSEDGLKQLIQKKNTNKFDDMISNLEKKYGANKVMKGSSKRNAKQDGKKLAGKKKSVYEELDDEAFTKAQEKLLNNKK